MSITQNLITNNKTPWLCIRDPSGTLVYFIHSKCACTFYKTLFNKLNWQICTVADINWDTNIVFSYIRNPIQKHRMGIIEWFYFFKQEELLTANFNNTHFFQLLSEIVYLDIHSMSIYDHLGENSSKIIWIPIDQPTIDHRIVTLTLIEKYSLITEDIKKWFLELHPQHVSGKFKKECINKLLSIPPTPLIIKSIEVDQYLYDRAITPTNFEPANYRYRIAQLVSSGLSQIESEKIADQEVESGKYQNWDYS